VELSVRARIPLGRINRHGRSQRATGRARRWRSGFWPVSCRTPARAGGRRGREGRPVGLIRGVFGVLVGRKR